jgi:nicotinamidase-related amidase
MQKDFAKDFAQSFALEPSSTALVIVDMQYASACRATGLGKTMSEKGQEDILEYRFGRLDNVVLPNIVKLLDFFRKNKLHVIYVTVGSEMPDYSDIIPHARLFFMATNNTKGNREHEILDEIKPLPGDRVINKLSSGAFNSSNINIILMSMGIKYIVFTGVSTNTCVEVTARDAADRGYRCIIVEDGTAATVEALHNATLINFHRFAGRVERTEDVIKELSTALCR